MNQPVGAGLIGVGGDWVGDPVGIALPCPVAQRVIFPARGSIVSRRGDKLVFEVVAESLAAVRIQIVNYALDVASSVGRIRGIIVNQVKTVQPGN